MARIFGAVEPTHFEGYNLATLEVRCPYCGGVAKSMSVLTKASTLEEHLQTIQDKAMFCFDNPKCYNKPIIIKGKWANRYACNSASESHKAVSGL